MSSGKTFKATATPSLALLLNPLAWFIWLLDFAVWLLTFGWVKTLKFYLQPAYSVEVGEATRRHRDAVDKLSTSPVPDGEGGGAVLTTPKLFAWAAAKYGNEKAMGTRTYLGEYKEETWRFPKKKFGETTWLSFRELKARADAFGAALVSAEIGMKPVPRGKNVEDLTGPHTLLLFEDTCADWMTCALGALSQSLVVATSYATLGIDSVGSAIRESSVTTVVTNRRKVQDVAKLKSTCKTLKTIIYTEFHVQPEIVGSPISVPGKLQAKSLASCYLAKPTKSSHEPTPDQVAVIMYTSGSTGQPKGVLLKHEAVLASIAGLMDVLGKAATTGDCYLGYLPQSHILEFCAELTCLALGMHIGYADPRTLTSTGAVRERPDGPINQKPEWPDPQGAIQEFRPTFMAGVPKVWDILKKAMEDKVAEMSPLKKFIFNVAYVGRACALRQHRDAPLLKALVFKKLAKMLGGKLKATISGGGAISSEVQTFARVAFCAPAVQGYALTETCCSATVQPVDDGNVDGVAGAPLTSIEIRLESCAITDRDSKPYSSTDTSHLGQKCCGRGEVQMKGTPVTAGYFKQPAKTAEVFTSDGWFRSGDVGVWRPDGQLQIVDRLKNLIKLKGGEYVAIESMEKEYSTSSYVSGVNGGLMCYGDSDMDRPVAFVCADEKKCSAWADANNVAYKTFAELCTTPEMNKEVLASLVKAGKSGKLGANEILTGILLLPGTGEKERQPPRFEDPWTPENGSLTASNKLQRRKRVLTKLWDDLDAIDRAIISNFH